MRLVFSLSYSYDTDTAFDLSVFVWRRSPVLTVTSVGVVFL